MPTTSKLIFSALCIARVVATLYIQVFHRPIRPQVPCNSSNTNNRTTSTVNLEPHKETSEHQETHIDRSETPVDRSETPIVHTETPIVHMKTPIDHAEIPAEPSESPVDHRISTVNRRTSMKGHARRGAVDLGRRTFMSVGCMLLRHRGRPVEIHAMVMVEKKKLAVTATASLHPKKRSPDKNEEKSVRNRHDPVDHDKDGATLGKT